MNEQITHKEVIEKVNKYMYGDATIYTSDLLHLILDYANQQEQKDKVLNAEIEENRKATKLLDLYKKLFGFCHFKIFYNPNYKPIYFTIHIKQKRPENQQALKALLEIKEIEKGSGDKL